MLPPTSPQYTHSQYAPFPSVARGAPVPSPYARESQATSTHRPGSSMSISSMLGTNPEDKPREPASVHRTNGFGSSSAAPMTAPLPTSAPSPTRPEFGTGQQVYRAQTPDAYKNHRAGHTRPSRAYSGGPPPRPFSGSQASSPDVFRFGPPLNAFNNQPSSQFSNTQEKSPYLEDSAMSQARRSSLNNLEQLTNYRQTGFRTPPVEPGNNHDSNQRYPRPVNEELLDQRLRHESMNKDEPILRHKPNSASVPTFYEIDRRAPGPAQNQSPTNARPDHAGESSGTNYPFLSRSIRHDQRTDDRPQNGSQNGTEPKNEYPYKARPGTIPSAQTTEPWKRPNDSPYTGLNQAYQDARHVPIHPVDELRQQAMRDSPSISTPTERSQPALVADRIDQQMGQMDEPQLQKNLLGLMVENNKRSGRVSPLPQAVQGAQGRTRGPASEPGIKNEFARMFSGIGSGVGSAMSTPVPQELGASISFPSSPTRTEEVERRTPFSGRNDLVENIKPRVTSRGGRRSRKMKDEESRIDVGNVSGQGLTRSFSARGAKRSRQSYNISNHV